MLVGQKVVRPRDGITHRLQACREIACTTDEHLQAIGEPGKQRGGREDFDPGGRKLDRQRQAIETAADLDDGGRVSFREREVRPHRPCPLDKERHGWVPGKLLQIEPPCQIRERKGLDAELLLAAQAKRNAARDEGAKLRACPKEPGKLRCCRDHLLEVIEDQQVSLGLEQRNEQARQRLSASLNQTQ